MSTSSPEQQTAASLGLLGGYQLRLPVFEGPFEVLLRLIERDQLAITDVSLVLITDQFLDHVRALSDAPVELLAEFSSIAARLIALKSRSLLPARPRVDVEPDEQDLAGQLRVYQLARATAAQLREREARELRSWARTVPLPPELRLVESRLAPAPAGALARALQRCLRRSPESPTRHRQSPVISLAAMTRRILAQLGRGRTPFRRLLGPQASRSEIVVGFIALLALLRRQAVSARQAELFSEIEIEAAVPAIHD